MERLIQGQYAKLRPRVGTGELQAPFDRFRSAVGEECEDVALEPVASRVRHRVDRPADRPAVPRIVAALLHLDGPHEVVWQGEAGHRQRALEVRGRRVDAVDEIGVLEPRGPADIHRVAGVIARVGVWQKCDDGTVIAADRQRVVGGRIDVRSDRRARGIDGKPLGRHADLPELDRLGLDRDEANVRRATDPDGNAVDDDGSEPDPRQPV